MYYIEIPSSKKPHVKNILILYCRNVNRILLFKKANLAFKSPMPIKQPIFKVIFHNQGKIYELYAHHVSQADLWGFVEIGEIIFGERTAVLVDPGEEKLKSEFSSVKRTYIPMHAIIRVDEVKREGTNKIMSIGEKGSNVMPFPSPVYTPPGRDPG